ncbi:MAG: Rrf2 family transcriptional regulator [Armatimonadetes bacterium]|nr:Rrf2 family transcriptional regulator [Armatimonadota bacterium]
MHLSRRSEYALLALVDLAVESRGERVQLHDIAQRQHIPEKYLEQLLRPLKTAGVVVATRGSRGGYQLARGVAQVTVLEIIEAVEGPLSADEDPRHGGPGSQAVRELWSEVTDQLRQQLAAVSLAGLVARYQANRTSDDWVI